MKKRRISVTTQVALVISALLLVGNIVLGSLLLRSSKTLMKTMINERMLDIANTAAAMVDGDVLKTLTLGDEGTPEYNAIYDALRLFQDNIDLEYIYTVRDMGNGAFVFLIDPAEENASEFGELVTVTTALKSASLGVPAVDEEPYQDQWGRFYSAYSPVRDSAGRVTGVVAVDFRADWYDQQISKYATTVLLFCVISLAVGALAIFAITTRVRDRFRTLNKELASLTGEVDELARQLGVDEDDPVDEEVNGTDEEPSSGDETDEEMKELGRQIRSVRKRLHRYNKTHT